MIQYTVRLADLNGHHFEVQCRLLNPHREQRFTLPSWIPGSYLLREYSRHIVSIRADSDGRAVAIDKIAKSTWRCRDAGACLTVTIEVFALDGSVRGAYLDGRRGYFNGTCLFLSPDGREDDPAQLLIERPGDARCARWRVATAMTAETVDEAGFGTYTARSYEELIDHPVEISDFAEITFQAHAVPHRLILAGRHRTDPQRIATDLSRLCGAHIDLFGTPPPFDAYCFLGLAVGDGYGGLEHRASSSLIFRRDDLPKVGESGVSRDYQRFLSLCSHEYFHTWNVKRIKPKAFTPYRLDRRAHTRLLWVFEGITCYYQDLLLMRSGLIGPQDYLVRLGQLLTRVYRAPGRLRQSIAEASFDAWDKLYKPEANAGNATISYYSKGALVALALDLTIRRESRADLDQVMRALWQRFGQTARGVEESQFEALSQEVTGLDLADFFEHAVRGTGDLPLAALLADFGVTLAFHAARPGDASGMPRRESDPAVDLGAQYRRHPQGLELTAVVADRPAERAGLNPGDVLIALDGLAVDERSLPQRLKHLVAGETVAATVFRGDELLAFGITLEDAPGDTCVLRLDEKADAAARRRRKAWLGK